MRYSIGKNQIAPAPPRAEQIKWLVIFGFWTFFAFLNANQIYFEMLHSPDMHHSWWRIAVWQLLVWYVWGGLSPLVLAMGRRWPVEGSRWWRGLLVHLPAAAVFSAFHSFMTIVLTVTIRPFDVWTIQRPFLFQFEGNLKGFFLFNFAIYCAILGVGYAFDYRKKYLERAAQAAALKSQLAGAQLEALKMQLHPHFLFNTLHTIAGLVRTNERDPAVNMIAGLSDLLRHALDSAAEQEVPLGEEVKFIELYLDIQKARFSDRLTVRMEIAPETLKARVPNLILQPLVENAIRHGVSIDDIYGQIVIEAYRNNEKLQLKVTDNGPGLNAGWRLEQNEGIGLANTVERLRHLYGDEQRFELVSGMNGGTVATVTIPFDAGWNE